MKKQSPPPTRPKRERMGELLWHFGNDNVTKDEFWLLMKANEFTNDDIDRYLNETL
jgi:hypothetical protein